VGRCDVLSSLSQALEPSASLVTLLGSGGMGKTRLARRYGWESLERWPGGVWFCDLTEARDVNGIAVAVATTLDVPLTKGDPIAQLGHAIAGHGRGLVILDNVEHVAEHARATLGRWAARARETSFLVTSRERLQLEGEKVFELEPLKPETEGVELFEERARAQRPGFSVTPESRAMVIEIVRLLDGLPLAIEFAASRVRMLSLEQLRERLGDRFSILSGSRRGRHATMRATLDWSWSSLTSWEQSAVVQSSVFQGGFTLEAAEAVIDLSAEADAPMVLDVIQSLVDKSWLRARVVLQSPRFAMYSTVQEYVAERRTAERGAAMARHGAYFATRGTQQAIEALEGHGGTAARAALRAELDNLIFACGNSLASHRAEIAGANYLAAAAVLDLQGPAEISAELGWRVLAHLQDPELRGRVLASVAQAELTAGRVVDAQSHLEAALALHREAGDRRSEGRVLGTMGSLHGLQGRMEDARSHFEAALALHREVGDRPSEGNALGDLGALDWQQGRMEEARSHLEMALSIHREVGNRRLEGKVRSNLGALHWAQGRLEEARSEYEGALALHREVGDRRSEGIVLGNLGALLLQQGRMEEACSHFDAALALHREVGNRRFEGLGLGNLGDLHREQGRLEEARSHYEAGLVILREVGDRRSEGIVLGILGVLHLERGRLEEARSDLDAALDLHREVGNLRFEGMTLGSLGALHLEEGRLEEARRCLDQGAGILRRVDDRVELGIVVCKQGTLEIAQGNFDAAKSLLAEAEQISEAVGVAPESELGREIAKLRRVRSEAPDA
jgi:predicted ATPase/Tfp pilus assembly protein PilF